MKKLSKLFLVLILVCSVLFSVACGKADVSEIEKSLKSAGYTVTKTEGKSQYISKTYLNAKGGFTEIIARSTGYLPDEDLNFEKVVNGNYIADEDGDYVYDELLGTYRLAKSDEDGNYSLDSNLYYPETDGDYVYDKTLGAYVLDTDVNYFDVVDDAFYNDGAGNFTTSDAIDFIEDKGGRYVPDKGGAYVYDSESQKIVEILVDKFFEEKDGKYVAYTGEDTTGKFVRDAKVSSKYYEFDGTFYAFDKKGDYVYDEATSEYVLDEDVNFAAKAGGNYEENPLGQYVYDNKLEQYVLDADVNYIEGGVIYVPSVIGTFVKDGDSYKSEIGSRVSVKYEGTNYDIDNKRYLKSGDNYSQDKTAKYYFDGINYVKNDAGNFIKDGSSFVEDTRAKYIKLADDKYILDDENVEYYYYAGSKLEKDEAGTRYAALKTYVKVENRDDKGKSYYKFDDAKNTYSLDKDKNFSFVTDRYVPVETRTPGADGKIYKWDLADDNNNVYGFIVDNDVNFAKVGEGEDAEYVADVNGEYKKEDVYIVVLVFEKKKDAKEVYNSLYGDLYSSKCYEELYGKVKRGYVSARNGNIIYIGYSDYLDAIGDARF